MEPQPLTAPPAILEKVLQLLIPPAAREAVVGDLREIYCGPAQYLAEALRTVPRVVLSCAIRAANPPLLLLQGGLVFFCLMGLSASLWRLSPVEAVLGTVVVLAGTLLCETYRQIGRPTVERSIVEAILIAIFIIGFCPEILGRLRMAPVGTPDFQLALQFVMLLPLAIPVLGILRTLLVVQGDRELGDFADNHANPALSDGYPAFVRHIRLGQLWEALALLIFAITGQVFLHIGVWFVGLSILVAFFLLVLARAPSGAVQNAFALRAEYRRLFLQRQQLRRFLAWLWAAPLLVLLYEHFIRTGLATGRGVLVMIGSAAVISTCFLVGAVNRECTGRAQEKVRLLERSR